MILLYLIRVYYIHYEKFDNVNKLQKSNVKTYLTPYVASDAMPQKRAESKVENIPGIP